MKPVESTVVDFFNRGDWQQVIRHYKKNRKNLGKSLVVQYVALAHINMGNISKAAKLFSELSQSFPDNLDINVNHAQCLAELNDHKKAILIYKKILSHRPEHLVANYNLAVVYFKLSNYQAAKECLERLLESQVDLEVFELLLDIFLRLREPEKVLDLTENTSTAQTVHKSKLHSINIDKSRALAFRMLKKFDESEEILLTAIQRYSQKDELKILLAELYESGNKIESALSVLNQVSDASLHQELKLFLMAKLEPETQQAKEKFTKLLHMAKDSEIKQKAATELGKLHIRNYDVDEAWQCFETAVKVKRASLPGNSVEVDLLTSFERWDIPQYKSDVDILAQRQASTRSFYKPVFLSGMPRSGTTLVSTLLDGHSRISVLEEVPFFNELANQIHGQFTTLSVNDHEVEKLARSYHNSLKAYFSEDIDGRFVVDKFPLNFIYLSAMELLFPNAKLVFVKRNPIDSIVSCYMNNFGMCHINKNKSGLHNVIEFFERAINYWEEAKSLSNLEIMEIKYEDMVEDVSTTASELSRFIGIDFESEMLKTSRNALKRKTIGTPSYKQVTQPIYKSSVNRWHQFEPYLTQHMETLSALCEIYHYKI